MYASPHGPDSPCCRNCRYFKPLTPEQMEQGEDGSWDEETPDGEAGKCVRYPPKFFYQDLLNGEFPVVDAEEYCGEHARNTLF